MDSKNLIGALTVGLVLASAYGVYATFRLAEITPPDYPERASMRYPVNEANDFITNYLTGARPIAEEGWLINSSELRAFVYRAPYVHISLARKTTNAEGITLVVSSATDQYNHAYPIGKVRGIDNTPYALQSVHPCPDCFDIDDANATMRVSPTLMPQPLNGPEPQDAVQRPPTP